MSHAYLASNDTETCNGRGARSQPEPERWRAGLKVLAAIILPFAFATVMLYSPSPALANSAAAQVSVGISVNFGPPPLPVYAQPMCPGPGYIWTPGYWAYDPVAGYYWVPGTWVFAPFEGALWTPGYWGWDPVGAVFLWHAGYWGPRVGFYGGIDYGFGYTGIGYAGGYWRGRDFYYNREVNNVNVVNIRDVYNRTVIVNNETNVSYNGGRGGIMASPTRSDMAAEQDRRMGPVHDQMNQEDMARGNRDMRWSENHGRPDIAATPRPGVFRGNDISHASRAGGSYTPGREVPNQPRNFGQPERQPQPRNFGQPGRQPRNFGGQPGNQPANQPRNFGQPERQPQPRNFGGPGRQPQSRPQAQPQPRQEQPQRGRPQQGGGGNQNRGDKGNGRGRGQ